MQGRESPGPHHDTLIPMDIAKNRVATLNYTIRDDDGHILETTIGKIPFSYIQGHEQTLDAIEQAVQGKTTGDLLELTLSEELAYGPRDESLTSILPLAVFQGVDEVKPGMRFEMPHDEGIHVATIIEVKGNDVKIDNNHPLAGKNLHIQIEIVDVRSMTNEERETLQARQMYEFMDE